MDFWGDERGQPVQIGFILLFGILVLTFAGYQGYVVPNQNSQVEFQHSQESSNEMQTFREDFLGAAEDGRRFSAGFTLGTDYQPRLIALNPPPVSGKLRTEQPGSGRFYLDTGDQSLAEVCGVEQDGDGGVPSKALVYQPSYNEYQNSPRVVYENTVTYNRFSRNDAVTMTTEQTLIQGTDILIPPLAGEVSEDGTERHTVDLYPGKAGVGEASGSGMSLTVPTELGVEQWESLLEDEMGEDGKVESVSPNGSNVDIALEAGSYDITCPVIGVGDQPDNEPAQVQGGGNEINPAAPGEVQLVGAEWSADEVTLTFRNSAENNSFTQGRINFYDDSTGGNQAGLSELNDAEGTENPRSENWNIGGDYEDIEPNIHLEGGGATTSIEYVFEDNPNEQNHWFVTTLTLSSGEHATYFVGGSFSQDTSDMGDGSAGGETNGFDIISASHMVSSQEQTQTLNFTITGTLSETETIEIDLIDTDRQQGSQSISYQNPQIVSGGGSVTLSNRIVTYSPPSGGLSDGDSVNIGISADTGSQTDGNSYTVNFSQSDSGSSPSTSFSVS